MTTLEMHDIPTAAAPKPTVVDIVARAIESNATIDAMTALYLKLRNAESDLKNQFKEKASPIIQGKALIEGYFLEKMQELGVDSLKNENGTPYKSETVSVTTADNEAFLTYVLDRALSGLPLPDAARATVRDGMLNSGQLSLLEARASKSAVEALVEATGELPPGLNRRVELKVNVRSS